MNAISIRTASVALHGIVNGPSSGGKREFFIRDLMRHWSRTGLRNSDLGIALSDATNRRCLKLEVKADGPMSVILDTSFGLDPASEEFDQELRTLATLRQLRGGSNHSQPVEGYGRRMEDADNDSEFLQQA